jgi:hypothetical protein
MKEPLHISSNKSKRFITYEFAPAPFYCTTAKKDRIKEATLRFGRRNQMSSSNILSIHGLKKKHQFQDSNRDINGDCVHVTIMYVAYSITRRSSDLTVLDVWPAQPLKGQ